jgi:hypothetical protein
MTEILKESAWKPVSLGRAKNGYDITATAVSSSWYNTQLDNSGTRLTRLRRFHDADCCSVEISRALDILAQDISSSNADDEPIFYLDYDENIDFKKSTISLLNEMKNLWEKRTEFEDKLFDRVRKVLKYGSQFWRRNADGSLKYYPTERMIGYILNEDNEEEVTHYVYDPKAQLVEQDHNFIRNLSQQQKKKEVEVIPVSELVILKIGDKPFGESVLEKVYSTWRQLHMLETAMVIYRVVRAPERRIYYIDTGNLQGHKREAAIEKQRLRLMQKQVTKGNTGDVSTEYDPHSTSEDIFIPTNSQGKGSRVETLQGGCLAMDTKVALLDGRHLSIKDIEDEMKSGKTLWTYSACPETGKLAAGLITWAGVTQKSAKVMRITLDNGETVVCTLDHKFPVQQKGFLRADELKIGESMMPFTKKFEKISEKTGDYELVYDISTREWIYTHRLVADSLRGDVVEVNDYLNEGEDANFYVRHHKDFDRYNNDPSNLCFMTWLGHMKLHSDFGFSEEMQEKGTIAAKERLVKMKAEDPDAYAEHVEKVRRNTKAWWDSLTQTERDDMSKIFSKNIKNYIESLSEEEKEARAEISRINFKKGSDVFHEKFATDPEFAEFIMKKRMEYWTEENRKAHGAKSSKNMKKLWDNNRETLLKNHKERQKLVFSQSMMDCAISLCSGKTTHEYTIESLVSDMNNNSEIVGEFLELNSKKSTPNFSVENGFTKGSIIKMCKQYGYKTYHQFRKNLKLHNHKIVNIEILDDEIEVGTLTIDGQEKYHDYHTFALSCGIFTKNSALGEVRDVKYFLDKLAAGLRIPSSMIDSGGEESRDQYSDMRVGQVYQIEIRYIGHIKRIQRYFEKVLHCEFEMFCKNREVMIPEGIKLMINEPTSFALYKEIEVNQALLNVYNSTMSIQQLSKKYAMKKYLGFDDEDLRQNERDKLIQIGLDDKTIKALDQRLIENIVYGDGRAAANNLGLPPETFQPTGY